MDQTEFDKFADEYKSLHQNNIKNSGENPDFFAEYKIKDTYDVIKSSISTTIPLKILDFGSGIGNSIPFFHKYINNLELHCIDPSQKSLTIAQNRFPEKANFIKSNGKNIPFQDNTFDVIFTACVFHHIPPAEHDELLKEILRTLKIGGLFIVFEHNPYNPLTRHAVNTCPFDENAILIPLSQFKNNLKLAGFSNIKTKYRIFFPNLLKLLRPLEHKIGWLPLGAQYYIAAYKA